MFIRSRFLSPEASPAAPPAAAPPAVPPVTPERRADDFISRAILQHGTVENALRQTTIRCLTAEDQSATLTGQLDQYKAKLPEGSVVLTKAEAENWAKLVALKLTPDQIVEGLQERDRLKGEAAEHALEQVAREAAVAGGVDPDAFVDHVKAKKLHIELRDTPVVEQGKTLQKRLPHVRPAADPTAPLKALSDYTTALPAHEQRALKPGTVPPPPTGTPYPEQRPAPTGGNTGDKVADFITQRNQTAASKPSPFAPPRPAAAASP